MRTERRIYDSMQELLAASQHDRTAMPWGEPSSKREDDNEWHGGSVAHVSNLAHRGWEGVVAETDALASRITDAVVKQRIVTRWEQQRDTYGSRVDVGRFLAGEPECMIRSRRRQRRGAAKVVRIVVPTTYSASVGEDVVRRRGAAVVALVDVLNRAGNRLEIWSWNGITIGGNRESIATKIQDAADPVNMGRIMFALAHPGLLRRVVFGVQENPAVFDESWIRDRGEGYGMPIKGAPLDDEIPGANDGPTVTLPSLTYGESWTVDDSVAWIIRELDRILADD